MTIYPILRELLLLELNINVQENLKFSSRLVVAAGAACSRLSRGHMVRAPIDAIRQDNLGKYTSSREQYTNCGKLMNILF